MNKIVLFGRLGRDPQLRVTHPVCHFSLAVSEPYTDRDTGERIECTTWFHVTAWNKLAEIASEYLHRGDQVLVEGRIQLREFKGRDGNQRAMLQVIASRIEFGARSARTDADDAGPTDDRDDSSDDAPEDFSIDDGPTDDADFAVEGDDG